LLHIYIIDCYISNGVRSVGGRCLCYQRCVYYLGTLLLPVIFSRSHDAIKHDHRRRPMLYSLSRSHFCRPTEYNRFVSLHDSWTGAQFCPCFMSLSLMLTMLLESHSSGMKQATLSSVMVRFAPELCEPW